MWVFGSIKGVAMHDIEDAAQKQTDSAWNAEVFRIQKSIKHGLNRIECFDFGGHEKINEIRAHPCPMSFLVLAYPDDFCDQIH